MKKVIFFLFAVCSLLFGCNGNRAEEPGFNASDSSASLTSTIQSLRIPGKLVSFTDLAIGVNRKEVNKLFFNTPYEVKEVPFGKLNTEIQFLNASPVKWWGLEGELEIEFSEKKGKSIAITWTVSDLSQSDFEILTKLITKDLPDASNSKGVNSGYFAHTWKLKNKSYDLIWHEGSGRTEFKMPAEAIYYPM